MEILIAILLALILVALVSISKDAAAGIGKVMRIFIFVIVAAVVWGALIGYSCFYYYSYTKQSGFNTIGIAIAVVVPPIGMWVNRAWIKELFSKDIKTFLKYLIYLVLGLAAALGASTLYEEQKKIDPTLGWTILLFSFLISGCVILNRVLNKGWRATFKEPLEPWEIVNNKYDELVRLESQRWKTDSSPYRALLADHPNIYESAEYKSLREKHYAIDQKISVERNIELKKASSLSKKQDWWLLVFCYTIAFICFGLIGELWNFALEWLKTH